MSAIRTRFPLVLLVVGLLLPHGVRSSAWGQQRADSPKSPSETAPIESEPADEATLIAHIKELTQGDHANDPPAAARALRVLEKQETLKLIEDLLKRFPETSFRDDAQIIKLGIYADFSRSRVEYLGELLAMTNEIGAGKPSKRLAAESDFYAIQAFVYAARNEGMPKERRLVGTAERYRAFLADHPESPRRPIMYASLVRVLVQQGQYDEAQKLLEKFRSEFPRHPALQRAEGEVARMRGIGQPYDFAWLTAAGGESTADSLSGKVVVIHFWASWSEDSTELVAELRSSYDLYGPAKLTIIGVNLDTDQQAFRAAIETLRMPWLQLSELKGFKSDLVVSSGVVTLPTTLIIDRKGILRAAGDGGDLREVLARLIPAKNSD